MSSMVPPNVLAHEDGQRPYAARVWQLEGQRSESNYVEEFIVPLGRVGRLFHGPEHRDCQGESQNERQGYVEVLAHPLLCTDLFRLRQAVS